jgi:hypothetical protein
MGKAYANRKAEKQRPESDFYRTPECLTWELIGLHVLDRDVPIYEPMVGDGAISKVLWAHEFSVTCDDIRTTGRNFLEFEGKVPVIVTNPAFSIFTETVQKCKEVCTDKFILLGKTNFFAAHNRTVAKTWEGLKDVWVFDRQVDYRTPKNKKGHFCVGNLVTGWMLWERNWESPARLHILDVNKYATMGSYDKLKEER